MSRENVKSIACRTVSLADVDRETRDDGTILLQRISRITMDDLARDVTIPEIRDMVPIYMRITEERVFNGYITIDHFGHCNINWWNHPSRPTDVQYPILHTFNSPNRWKRFIEKTLGIVSPFEGFWDHTFVNGSNGTCTLSSLKYRHLINSSREIHQKRFHYD
jgi:hypothetical protein